MEVLGTYDPVPRVPLATDTPDTVDNHETGLPRPPQKRYKKIQLDTSRTKYWLGVGAQPSEPVWRLFSLVRLTNVVFPQRGRAK
jgi:small subunit ribosomal protein S16